MNTLCKILFCAGLVASAFGAEYRYTAKPGDVVTITVEAGAPEVPVPVGVMPSIGLNLEPPADYERGVYFSNAIRSARCIDGNPTTGRSVWRVLTTTDNLAPDGKPHGSLPPANVAGVYTLTYTGGGTVSATGATLSNGKLTFAGSGNVDITFTAPVSNIALWRPGYGPTSGTFTAEFLNDLKPFTTLRFMDWQNTNCDRMPERQARYGANGKIDWSERPLLTDATYTGALGVPIEVCVALCNASKKDGWFSIPHDSSDDWVRGFFAYLKQNGDPSLNWYFEFSNEITFNAIFPQWAWAKAEANAYIVAGTLPSLYPIAPGNDNEQYRVNHFTLKRLLECEAIARSVFGAEMLTRVRPVFSVQFATRGPSVDALWWANKTGLGPVDKKIWALAVAPYYGPGDPKVGDLATTDTSFAAINRQLDARDAWAPANMEQWYSVAKAFGMKLACYESGIDHGEDSVNLDVLNAVAYDARSGPVTTRYLGQLLEVCDGPVNYFHYAGTNSRWGQYGLKDNSTGPAPKWDAAVKLATTRTPAKAGLSWDITRGTIRTTRVQGPFINLVNYQTGSAVYDPGVSQSFEARGFTAVISGTYTPVVGVSALVAECAPTDTVVMAAPTTFTPGVAVDIKLTYTGDFGGQGASGGIAWLRLFEVVNGVKRQVPQNRLSP